MLYGRFNVSSMERLVLCGQEDPLSLDDLSGLTNQAADEFVMGDLLNDPIRVLLSSANDGIVYFTRRDLLGETVEPVESLWELPAPLNLIRKQHSSGCWLYARETDSHFNHDLVETFRNVSVLVSCYGFNRHHPAIQRAKEYIFSNQTDEGDLRGILGNQYMPYYHGAILALLILAGYIDESEIIHGLDWLLGMNQYDGGWVIPLQTVKAAEKTALYGRDPIRPDRSLKSSHMATGMVLRAFVEHPRYRVKDKVIGAGKWIKSRFFKSDHYNDRKAPHFWTKFQFPFWWTDLLSVLDSLSKLEISSDDPDFHAGITWFINHQQDDGLWGTQYEKARNKEIREWVGLAVCRVLKRMKTTTFTRTD